MESRLEVEKEVKYDTQLHLVFLIFHVSKYMLFFMRMLCVVQEMMDAMAQEVEEVEKTSKEQLAAAEAKVKSLSLELEKSRAGAGTLVRGFKLIQVS